MYWKSVSKELPKEEGTYLVTAENPVTKELEVWIEQYSNKLAPHANVSDETVFENGFAFGEPWPDGLDNLANVFAWMPIPKPYNPNMPSDKGDEEHN